MVVYRCIKDVLTERNVKYSVTQDTHWPLQHIFKLKIHDIGSISRKYETINEYKKTIAAMLF